MYLGSWSRNVILAYNPMFITVRTEARFLLVVSRRVYIFVWKLITVYTNLH